MCEPTPTSTIYSQSTSKISTEYVTSTPVALSGTVTIRTITSSSCLSTAQPTVSSARSSRVVSWQSSSQDSPRLDPTTSESGTPPSSSVPLSQPSDENGFSTVSVAPPSTPAKVYGMAAPTSSANPKAWIPSSAAPDAMLVAVPTSDAPTILEITSTVEDRSIYGAITPPEAVVSDSPVEVPAEIPPPIETPDAAVSIVAPAPSYEPVAQVNVIASPAVPADTATVPPPAETPGVPAPSEQDAVPPPEAPPPLPPPPPPAEGQGGHQGKHGPHKRDWHHWQGDDDNEGNRGTPVPADDSKCASWTINTSYETLTGRPSTTWSTWTVTTTTNVVTRVPVSTLYAECTSTRGEGHGNTKEHQWGEETTSSSVETSSSADLWHQNAIWTPSSSAGPVSSTAVNDGAFIGDTSTSVDWVASTTEVTSSMVSSTSSLYPSSSQTPFRSTSAIENTYTRLPPPPPSSSASARSQNHPAEQGNSSSSKAVSAGAAVGGIVGLLLAIAGVLALVRWYLQRKRTKKTRMMRSSWFYGGDVREEEQDDDDENEVRTEKHHSSMPVSRFSAASITPRQSRISMHAPRITVPSFMSLGSAFRNSTNRFPSMLPTAARQSGRFPNVFQDMRKSVAGMSIRRQSQYQRYTDEPDTDAPTVPPTPVRTVNDALSGDPRAIRTISPDLPPVPQIPSKFERLARPPPPDSVVPASAAMASSRWTEGPPRAEEAKRPTLNWGDSYASRFIPQTAGPSEASRSSNAQTEIISSALPSSVGHGENPGQWQHTSSLQTSSAARASSNALHSNGNSGDTTRAQSHYSHTGTVQSFYSQPEDFCLADLPEEIGRAITAPGRTSVEVHPFDASTYRGSIPFPEPRTKYTPSTGPPTSFSHSAIGRTLTVISQTPSSAAASEMRRTMEPIARLNVPGQRGRERDDSVFEFASMTGGSEGRRTQYTARTRSRADTEVTGDWYDKSLWDESAPGTAAQVSSSGLDKGKGKASDDRKSRGKSVRWGDEEEPLPRVFELARAL